MKAQAAEAENMRYRAEKAEEQRANTEREQLKATADLLLAEASLGWKVVHVKLGEGGATDAQAHVEGEKRETQSTAPPQAWRSRTSLVLDRVQMES